MAVREMCLSRNICAMICGVKDCRDCKKTYMACEKWKGIPTNIENFVVDLIIEKIKRKVDYMKGTF